MDTYIHAVRRLAADVAERKATELAFALFRVYLAAAGATQSGSWIYTPGRATPLKGWKRAAEYVVALPDSSAFMRDLAAAVAVGAEVHGAPKQLPRPPSATVDEISKVAGAVADLAKQIAAVSVPREPDPTQLTVVAGDDVPLSILDDAQREIVERMVRRAQYDALKTMLEHVDGWIEGARLNGAEPSAAEQFHADDIRAMINDTAREVGTRAPWRPAS